MKFRLFLIVLLFTSHANLSSQSFKGGLLGGLNAARIDNDRDELYGKLGLNAGAFVSRDILPEILEWQLEVKYTSRGKYNIDRDIYGTVISLSLIDLRYFEFPLSLQFKINEKMQVGLGFSPDILIKESYENQEGGLPLPKDRPNKVGLTAFGEFNYFVSDAFAVGIRFNYSVLPFMKFDGTAVRYRDSGWFHDVLSINAKYYLKTDID